MKAWPQFLCQACWAPQLFGVDVQVRATGVKPGVAEMLLEVLLLLRLTPKIQHAGPVVR